MNAVRKNLANRLDIEPDALRQRRDLYALSIGLMLFNLAGGKIAANTAFGSLLPISIERPWLLLCAAWLGFFYFWFRFWLVSEPAPLGAFIEDIQWQAGNNARVRRIAEKFAQGAPWQRSDGVARGLINGPDGLVPKIVWRGLTPILNLQGLTARRGRANFNQQSESIGPAECLLPTEDHSEIRLAWLIAIPRAIVRERAFTDYTLPHLVAVLTVLIGLARLVAFESLTFHHAPLAATVKPVARSAVVIKAAPAPKGVSR